MSDCASILEILIDHWIFRGLEVKNGRLGQRRKKHNFSSALPQGDCAMLITLASVQLVQKHHRENTNPEYDQRTGLLRPCRRYRMPSYSTIVGIYGYYPIGCPRIIRTCRFSRFSPLRWNRWCCGFQNFQNYSSRVKAKRHTLPKSAYYSVQSLDQLSVGNRFSVFVQRPNRQQGIGKKRNPGFHNRPIGMIFAGEPKSKV